jgi:intracellular sulfur oxidation DsrE/DsrF family protein
VNSIRLKTIAITLLAAITLVAIPTLQAAPIKTHKVIFVITSPDESDWALTIKNITALVDGLKPEPVEIEVLAYGPGIISLKKDSSMAADIRTLQSPHLRFVACHHAMLAHNLKLEDLAPGVTPVPSGIVELVRRQEQGWTYIKAGR